MLTQLAIDNFAIIDQLLLRFDEGFTVVTGETGAGKSIIIDALHAVLGARTGADAVRAGARYAVVEAVFDLPEESDDTLSSILEEHGVEPDEQLILRREISSAGRGAARINGRAVPLNTLSAIGGLLVDIHGQSDHLSVLRRDRQLEALDRHGGLLDLRSRAAGALREFGRLRRELETLEAGRREAERRLDLLRFQVGEIESALLQPDEEEDLAAERNLLVNAERLTQLSQGAREALVERAVGAIGEAAGALRDLSAIDPALAPLAERVASAQYDLDDVADELRRYGDRVEFDPQRLGAIEERLDLLMRLKRKYGATVAEVIEFGMQARAELEDVENLDERLAALSEAVSRAEEGAGSLAEALSRARASAARGLTEAMRAALGGLGLKSTEFRVEVMQTETDTGIGMPGSGRRLAFTQSGVDAVAFLVSFNPGEELRPLDRVASGGETSRFLLALKSVLAGADRTPTLVFDEVDVGIGGRHGTVVGERLRALARTHQVLSITHLPQVAALGDQHLSVSKAVRDGRTTVGVRSLEGTDRVVEIAEMMSGTGSETARRNAQELLEAARSGQ